VLVFVKKNLHSSHVSFDSSSEMVSFIINIDKQQVGAIACYRPPYQDHVSSFFISLNNHLNSFEAFDLEEMIIIGDLNFDMLDSKKSQEISDFISIESLKKTRVTRSFF